MIVEALYKQVVPLDRQVHRALRMKHPLNDLTPTRTMNSVFVATMEFYDICHDYPIVFVRAGKNPATGQDEFAPMAVLGIKPEENLFLQQPGGGWRVAYVPAFVRRYPFGMIGLPEGKSAVCIDRSWAGFSETEGEPLFGADGNSTELLKQHQQFVEGFDQEVARTRAFCSMLRDDGLLTDTRFDATMHDGELVGVDGFAVIDDKKLAELPDDKVLKYYRSGAMALMYAHRLSMPLMRRLVDWHIERIATHQ